MLDCKCRNDKEISMNNSKTKTKTFMTSYENYTNKYYRKNIHTHTNIKIKINTSNITINNNLI